MTTPNFTPRPWAAERIAFVIGAYEVSPDDFYGRRNEPRVTECRWAAAYLVYEFFGPGCSSMGLNESAWHLRSKHATIRGRINKLGRSRGQLKRADALAARLGLRKIGRSK